MISHATCWQMEEMDIVMVGNCALNTGRSNYVSEGCIVSGVHEDSSSGVSLLDNGEAYAEAHVDRDIFWKEDDDHEYNCMEEFNGQDADVAEAQGAVSMAAQEEINGVGAVEAGWNDSDAWVEELEDSEENDWDGEEERKRVNECKINEVYHNVGGEDGDNDDSTERFIYENRVKVTRFWMNQAEVYEQKIADLTKKLDNVSDGFRAAVRERDRWMFNCKRLNDRLGRLFEEKCEKELGYEAEKRKMTSETRELRYQLSAEQKKNKELELELKITRKPFHYHARLRLHWPTLGTLIQEVPDDDGSDSCVPISEESSGEGDKTNMN